MTTRRRCSAKVAVSTADGVGQEGIILAGPRGLPAASRMGRGQWGADHQLSCVGTLGENHVLLEWELPVPTEWERFIGTFEAKVVTGSCLLVGAFGPQSSHWTPKALQTLRSVTF